MTPEQFVNVLNIFMIVWLSVTILFFIVVGFMLKKEKKNWITKIFD